MLKKTRTCRNNCIFCFVNQLPEGLRRPLYLKDDDYDMSVLFGNYITCTNLTENDIKDIIKKHLSPLYISVHAADKALRREILRPAGGADADIMPLLEKLYNAGIVIHAQAVICPGINDGEYLKDTIRRLRPFCRSLAVVPVGLTKYAKNNVKAVTAEKAAEIIDICESFQSEFLRRNGGRINNDGEKKETPAADNGGRFVFCADELYLKASRPLPPPESYESFCQLDNGVGMLSKFIYEFDAALTDYKEENSFAKSGAKENSTAGNDIQNTPDVNRTAIVTGVSAYPHIKQLCEKAAACVNAPAGKSGSKNQTLKIDVIPVRNNLFGDSVTVAGLVCGQDIISSFQCRPEKNVRYNRILIPDTMLRSEGDVFLDGMTPAALSAALGAPIIPVPVDGYDFFDALRCVNLSADK